MKHVNRVYLQDSALTYFLGSPIGPHVNDNSPNTYDIIIIMMNKKNGN